LRSRYKKLDDSFDDSDMWCPEVCEGDLPSHKLQVATSYDGHMDEEEPKSSLNLFSLQMSRSQISSSGKVRARYDSKVFDQFHKQLDNVIKRNQSELVLLHEKLGGLTKQQKQRELHHESHLVCIICLERQRGVIFFPCRHIACCRNCAINKLRPAPTDTGTIDSATQGGKAKLCPIDNEIITSMSRVYFG